METKARPMLYSDYRGPGPLAYGLKPLIGKRDHDQTRKAAPAYSIGARNLPAINRNPGPFEYNVTDTLTSRGKQDAPAITLKGRGKNLLVHEITPGPGAYMAGNVNMLSTRRSVPAPSLGPRTKVPDYRCAPAPTAYSLPSNSTSGGLGDITKRNAPSWSFRPRAEFGSPQYEGCSKSVPAPTIYRCPDPSVYKRKSGSFSLGPRTKQPQYNTSFNNPGPGAYELGSPLNKKGKGPSIGSRHSERMMLILHPNDVV